MKLQKYEILICGKWEPVKGTTSCMAIGWLQWKDSDGCTGVARPGTWRLRDKERKEK